MLLKNQKDYAAGMFYVVIGITAILTLNGNELGTLARMGPGFFPTVIATGLILTGLAIAVKAVLRAPVSPDEGRIHFGKPISALLILGSAAFYAATLLTLGFFLSIGGMIVIASIAHPAFRLRDALISAVFLTSLSAVLFIWGLGLIVPLWPVFF